jgi:putative PEP-CTERM system histidine kinase
MFGIITSGVAGVSLVALSAYIILKGRNAASSVLSASLVLLALAEAADQLALHATYDPLIFKKAALFVDSLLPAAFLYFSLIYARQRKLRSLPLSWLLLLGATAAFPVCVLLFPLDRFFYSPDFQSERLLFLGTAGYWFYMGLMVSLIIALVNIEATFSASSGRNRWKIKYEAIGISAALAVLVFYYSQGLLYRTINMNLIPVRAGVLIISAFLIFFSKSFRGNDVRLSVSRYIFYRSLTLLVVGLYLVSLGLIGEGMQYFGVSFSRELTVFVAFTTGIALLFVLFSEQLRRKTRVFINKHFYAHKHDYRDEWLKFTARLSSCRSMEDLKEVILRTYIETFELRAASLYLRGAETGQYMLAGDKEMPSGVTEFRASEALLSYFTERGRVFDPADGEHQPSAEEASFAKITGARLMVPLIVNDAVVGIVVFGRQLSRDGFIYEDYDLMKTLARQAALSIANLRLSEELSEAREVAAVARISSFVVHDLKNLTSMLSLVLDNAGDFIGEPDFQRDMLETVRKAVSRMRDLMQKLKRIPEKQVLNATPADIDCLARDTIGELKGLRPEVEIRYRGAPAVTMADVEEIKKVILNLVLNALDAVNGKGIIDVSAGHEKGMAYVRVKDNGCGMEEEFVKNHLFKPFRTTKAKGMGIGLYQCRQIIDAHNGSMEVESIKDKGSAFTVYLPAGEEVSPAFARNGTS